MPPTLKAGNAPNAATGVFTRTDYDGTGIVLHDDITFELIDLGLEIKIGESKKRNLCAHVHLFTRSANAEKSLYVKRNSIPTRIVKADFVYLV